jgi:hypothetical protein
LADSFKIIDSKKYLWDGEDYEAEPAARDRMSTYGNDGFETKLVEEDGKYLVYTRRVVTEIVIEGEPV